MSRIAILMYHAVVADNEPRDPRLCCTASAFRRQMRWLRESGRKIMSLTHVRRALDEGAALPDGAAVVTFDDGYRGVLEHAASVLEELSIPATVFAIAGRVGEVWTGPEGNRMALLNRTELATLSAAGVDIGSHSLTHPRLPDLEDGDLHRELAESRSRLEDLLGSRVPHLAYPYGACDARVANAARVAGYRAACTTRSGFNGAHTDPFHLHRIDVYGTDSLRSFRQKVELGTNDGSFGHRVGYYWRRARTLVTAAAGLRSRA